MGAPLPLTRPGGVQAWKIIVPVAQVTPNPRAHDGFEWLYVLSGRMRLVLGDRDLVLGVGEAAVRHHPCRTASASAATARLRCSASSGVRENVCRCASGGDEPEPHQDPHQ